MVKVAIIIFEKNTIDQQRSDYKSGLHCIRSLEMMD